MKLNLDFSLYKGKTRLKHWWPKVKEHFTQVQIAHNALEDTVAAEKTRLDTEIDQRTNADVALSDRINAEASTRASADTALSDRINAEAAAREEADNDLQSKLDTEEASRISADGELSTKITEEKNARVNADKDLGERISEEATDRFNADEELKNDIEQQLYNKKEKHIIKVVLPAVIPEIYFAEGDNYIGTNLRLTMPFSPKDDMQIYHNGKLISPSWRDIILDIDASNDNYVYLKYDTEGGGGFDVMVSYRPVTEWYGSSGFQIPLYHYTNIEVEYKISSISPTGECWKLEGYDSGYSSDNTDTTGETYTIVKEYLKSTGNKLSDLKTDVKTSFLEAVNELAAPISWGRLSQALKRKMTSDLFEVLTNGTMVNLSDAIVDINGLIIDTPAVVYIDEEGFNNTKYIRFLDKDNATREYTLSQGITTGKKYLFSEFETVITAIDQEDCCDGYIYVTPTETETLRDGINNIHKVVKTALDDMTSRIDNISSGTQGSVEPNDMTPTFTQASSRANIASGEKLSVIFGKIKKWFADLKTVAFTGSYGDLENAPAIIDRYDSTFIQGDDIDALRPVTDEKNKIIGFEQVALKTHFSDVAFSNDYNDLANKPEIIYDYDSQPFINGDPVATVSVMKDENGNVEEIRFFEVPLRLSEVAFTGSYNDLTDKPTIPPAVTVDSALSSSSTNPVQNKAVQAAIQELKDRKIIQSGTGTSVDGRSVILASDKGEITGNCSAIIASCPTYDTAYNIEADYCAALATGNMSITGGFSAIIGGYGSVVDGTRAVALGGQELQANAYNTVCGKRNKAPEASDYNVKSGDLFVVGNGDYWTESNAFRVAADGNCYAGVAFNGTGADYNEAREWSDGNVDNEDRCGYMVAFDGTKIRLAQPGDNLRKVGIISGNSCITGNNFADFWHGKYKRDIYGRYETKPVHNDAEYAEDGKMIKEEFDGFTYVLADDYDPELEDTYIPRLDRSEYDLMATHGEVVVRDDGTCEEDGYCIPGIDGIATRDNEEIGFYVMERVDENHIRVFVR